MLFLIYSLSIVTLAMWISVFIEKAKSSLNMGMGIFVLGLLFVAIVGNAYTIQAIYDDDLVPRAVPISFSFVPPFNLAKVKKNFFLMKLVTFTRLFSSLFSRLGNGRYQHGLCYLGHRGKS